MNRTEVIQRIIDKKRARTYLEIGVGEGNNFFPIRARRKIAVDPHFTFSSRRRLKWALKNWHNLSAQYHETSSDSFFAHYKPLDRFHVVFIDGLHIYDQALRDTINSLNNLSNTGIIILHDTSPPTQAAARPAASCDQAAEGRLPDWTGEWCGDVWKTICHLRSHRPDLRVFVLDCDYGLGIVTKGEPESRLDLSSKDLIDMTYADLARDRTRLLNLKDESYLGQFLESI